MIRYPYSPGLERRVKRLRISGDMFLEILKGMDGRRRLRTEQLPKDARTVGVAVDDQFNTVSVYVESAEFDAVPEGMVPDELLIFFTLYTGDAMPQPEQDCDTGAAR